MSKIKDIDNVNGDDELVYEDDKKEGEIEKLKEKLKKLSTEKKEYLDGWQRARAELSNNKKEEEERAKRAKDIVHEAVISEFLPILDSFDMAFSNKDRWESVDEKWRIGIENIYSQLISIMKTNNVESYGKIGDNFSPNIHDCIGVVEVSDKKQDDKVIEVLQKGYILNKQVIRPARVKIGECKK